MNLISQLLLLLSCNLSLNPGLVHQGTLQCSYEWNVFKKRALHFTHLQFKSLLSKIGSFVNAAIIDISECKLDSSILDPK